MHHKITALNAKIEKLQEKKRRIEEETIRKISNCILSVTKNGANLSTLTGMILDTSNIMNSSPHKMEAWQFSGEKFLGSSTHQTKRQSTQNQTTPLTI